MNRIYQRLLQVAGACIAAMAFGPAFAQINNVTDGSTTSTTCTSYTFSATGVLTFSPAGCLSSGTPPPVTPVFSFVTASSSVVETTATHNVVVRRTGTDLTSAASVVVRWTGGTAVSPTNFNMPQFALVSGNIEATINFPASGAGITTSEQNVVVSVVNASLPAGDSKTVGFVLASASSGNNLGATINHTVSINSALTPPPPVGDVTVTGASIPAGLPVGYYVNAQRPVCEGFQSQGSLNAPFPGDGGKSPCGSYEIPVTSSRNNCNSGMSNTVSTYGGGIGNVTNTIQSAYMFVNEDIVIGNTFSTGNNLNYALHQNAAWVMKFRTGGAGQYTALSGMPANVLGEVGFSFSTQPNRGESAVRFGSISTSPCDFSYTQFDAGNACYQNLNFQGGGTIIAQIVTGGAAEPGKCALQPNTTYYLNTRWEDVGFPNAGPNRGVISCKPSPTSLTGRYCGSVLNYAP